MIDLQKSFRNALDVIQLKEAAMQAVAADSEATKLAWGIVVLAALATGLGVMFFPVRMGLIVIRPDFFWLIQATVFESAAVLAALYLGGFAAQKWFHSQLSMAGFVRVMGHAAILGLLSVIPVLNLLCIWELVVLWRACTRLGKMQVEATVLFLVFLVLLGALTSALGGMAY